MGSPEAKCAITCPSPGLLPGARRPAVSHVLASIESLIGALRRPDTDPTSRVPAPPVTQRGGT
jgi:hypothetical protein